MSHTKHARTKAEPEQSKAKDSYKGSYDMSCAGEKAGAKLEQSQD